MGFISVVVALNRKGGYLMSTETQHHPIHQPKEFPLILILLLFFFMDDGFGGIGTDDNFLWIIILLFLFQGGRF